MPDLLFLRRALRLTMVVHEPREVQTPAEQEVKIALSIDNFSDTYARQVVRTYGCWLQAVRSIQQWTAHSRDNRAQNSGIVTINHDSYFGWYYFSFLGLTACLIHCEIPSDTPSDFRATEHLQ